MAKGGKIDTNVLSDEIFDVQCSMCKNKNKNTAGEKFCLECNDYFCKKCLQVHNQVPLCARHKVLDKSEVKSGTSKGLPRAPAERCDKHNHKHIDMYCQNHDNVGCSTCMATDHRSCKDTFYISEFIQNNTDRLVPKQTGTKLKDIAKTLTEQAHILKQDKQNILKRKAELLANIQKFRQQINDQLDKLEKRTVDEIEGKIKYLEDKIEEVLKQLQANKVRITSAYEKIASPNINQTDVFVYVKMGEDAANIASKCIEAAKPKSSVDDIEFQPETTILTQIEQSKTLGSLIEKTTMSDGTLFQVKGKQTYSVKMKSDENPCHITSVRIMEDGTIILADYNNKKLKHLNSYNYTDIDYCDLPGQPWQVCAINNTQVAVTVPSQKEVHFVSLERKMKTTYKIMTDFKCYGLANVNNELHISDSDTSINMYTMSGRKIKQFSIHQTGHKLFNRAYSLAISKDTTKIYVADYYNGLIVLDKNGQAVSLFKGEQLQNPTDCYVTEAGSVLVSRADSRNVLQFTSDGELIGEIVTANRGKSTIRSVCCNHQMSKMCISRFNEDEIEVHDICKV